MRIQKAINELVDYVAENDKLTISFETVTMARKALEKQMPKVEFQGEHRKCICGSFAVGEYCFKCGQKIGWSEVEGC